MLQRLDAKHQARAKIPQVHYTQQSTCQCVKDLKRKAKAWDEAANQLDTKSLQVKVRLSANLMLGKPFIL